LRRLFTLDEQVRSPVIAIIVHPACRLKPVAAVCRIFGIGYVPDAMSAPLRAAISPTNPPRLLHCCNTLRAIEDESHFGTRSSLVFRKRAAQDKIISEGAGGQPVEAGQYERTG
jgi:hypothetical protein